MNYAHLDLSAIENKTGLKTFQYIESVTVAEAHREREKF